MLLLDFFYERVKPVNWLNAS